MGENSPEKTGTGSIPVALRTVNLGEVAQYWFWQYGVC